MIAKAALRNSLMSCVSQDPSRKTCPEKVAILVSLISSPLCLMTRIGRLRGLLHKSAGCSKRNASRVETLLLLQELRRCPFCWPIDCAARPLKDPCISRLWREACLHAFGIINKKRHRYGTPRQWPYASSKGHCRWQWLACLFRRPSACCLQGLW